MQFWLMTFQILFYFYPKKKKKLHFHEHSFNKDEEMGYACEGKLIMVWRAYDDFVQNDNHMLY
jgi:hypothetical protein